MFDATIIIELLILIAMFFIYRYGSPIFKDVIFCKAAQRIVAAANELHITGEIQDKATQAWDQMIAFLKRYKIKFDEEEVKGYLKAAVTALRVEIDKTAAEYSSDKDN